MTAFGIKGPAASPATPFAIAPPVRGCLIWGDMFRANTSLRRKNLVKPLGAGPAFSSGVVDGANWETVGPATKRIVTDLLTPNEVTYMVLTRAPNIPDSSGQAATRMRTFYSYTDSTPIGGDSFGYHKEEWRLYRDGMSSSGDDPAAGYMALPPLTPMTGWHFGVAAYKPGEFWSIHDHTDGVGRIRPVTGARAPGSLPISLGGAATGSTTSVDGDIAWYAVFDRALSYEEQLAVLVGPRAMAAAVGIVA